MGVIFGSARNDSKGKLSGDKAGDNKQTTVNDYKGEVSLQPGYVHELGWVILRPKSDDLANRLAYAMLISCNNKHLGYDQSNRLGVMKYGIESTVDTECDCSSLVRACLKYCGINVGNFATDGAVTVIASSGQFTIEQFTSLNYVRTGDILVTKTKGHIVICVEGIQRPIKVNKPNVAKPVIKKGSKGDEVKNLQRDLNYLMNASLVIDGDMGNKSVNALKEWQKKYSLVVDGSYGNKSYAKMKELLS